MRYFDQFMEYRALAFKFGASGDIIEHAVNNGEFRDHQGNPVSAEEALQLKNVCAKLSSSLVDRMESTLNVLGISKRQFIELAVIYALDRVDVIFDKVEPFGSEDDLHQEGQA